MSSRARSSTLSTSASSSTFITLPDFDDPESSPPSPSAVSHGRARSSSAVSSLSAQRALDIEKQALLESYGKERGVQGPARDDLERGTLEDGGRDSGGAPQHSWTYVLPMWLLSLVLGFLLTMSNKYILSSTEFHYPVSLTTSHMAFAVLGTRLAEALGPRLFGRQIIDAEISWSSYCRSVLPIGVLFSASLVLSNSAMLVLSVSLVQMLKAFIPALILLLSCALRLRKLDPVSVIVILIISSGCALATFGELHFSLLGLSLQIGAMLAESSRLVMIQVLLQGQRMDPLTSLYHYAPVCLGLNLLLIPLIEGSAPLHALLHPSASLGLPPLVLFANAATAFSLNVVALFLLQIIGGVAQSLAGVVKDIALIAGSVMFFGNAVGLLQIFGYALSICGLLAYRWHSSRHV